MSQQKYLDPDFCVTSVMQKFLGDPLPSKPKSTNSGRAFSLFTCDDTGRGITVLPSINLKEALVLTSVSTDLMKVVHGSEWEKAFIRQEHIKRLRLLYIQFVLISGSNKYAYKLTLNHLVKESYDDILDDELVSTKIVNLIMLNMIPHLEEYAQSRLDDFQFLIDYFGANLESVPSMYFYKRNLNNLCITIPKTVKKIESYAFHFTQLLGVVEIPDSVKEIEKEAFSCNDIECVISGAEIIEEGAFHSNDKLQHLSLKNVKIIGEGAFTYCILTELTFPESLKKIGPAAFCHNELTLLSIPKNVEIIESEAFEKNKLIKVTLHSNTEYKQNSFDKSVTIVNI